MSILRPKKPDSKLEVEDCLQLSIFKLNQCNLIYNGYNSTITWTFPSGDKFNVGIHIYWDSGSYYIRLLYNSKRYDIELTETYCHYGGERYWFICPGLSSDKVCGKQAAVLYKPPNSNYFACKKCHNLTYESRNFSGIYRKVGFPLSIEELNTMRGNIKKLFYKGNETRRYIRYLKKLHQYETFYKLWLYDFRKTVGKFRRK